MWSIIYLQIQRFRREPGPVLWMIAMTCGFVLVMGGFGVGGKIGVPIFFDQSMNEEQQEQLLEQLNESDNYSFAVIEQKEAERQVALGEIGYAVKAMSDNYQMLISTNDPNQLLVDTYVEQVYTDELRMQEVEEHVESASIRDDLASLMEEAPIQLTRTAFGERNNAGGYNQQTQSLFGMTLFFSIYTIILSLGKVAEEKRTGTWNRVILSPVRKWQVYLGHLSYAFMIGFLQILLIFFSFYYMFDYDIGSQFGAIVATVACYTFSIVALGMLLLGLVKSVEQLNAVVPIVSVSMAMIGGAYWPIETVSNGILLGLAKVMPITYGMDALKGISMYKQDISTLAEPLSIMLLIGILFMGIGINLIERKA